MATIEEFLNPKDKTVLHPHDKAPNFSLKVMMAAFTA